MTRGGRCTVPHTSFPGRIGQRTAHEAGHRTEVNEPDLGQAEHSVIAKARENENNAPRLAYVDANRCMEQ